MEGLREQNRDVLNAKDLDELEKRVSHAKTEALRLADGVADALPTVDGVWDFRRNNLVYTVAGPVLVDPDNAGHICRIMDLATALMIWPIEGDSWSITTEALGSERAAPRPLTQLEWTDFMTEYKKHVSLTQVEREAWTGICHLVWIQELLWQMGDADNYKHKRDKTLMQHLVSWEYCQYTL
jgi:hypothetical protein